MRQSNAYILIFTAIVTIVLGGMLAFTSESLKDQKKIQVELDTKKSILSSVVNISEEMSSKEILSLYNERIYSFVVNSKGEKVDAGVPAEKIQIAKEYKKPNKEDRLLPVFALRDEVDPTKFEAYIVSVYGNGLWDAIWGFAAIGEDLNTIKGVIFDHKGETPGLGARITEKEVQKRYVGKSIYEGDKLVSVSILKGEGRDASTLGEHEVDGLSGASMTTGGVNKMLIDFFGSYDGFFQSVKTKGMNGYLDAEAIKAAEESKKKSQVKPKEKVTIE